uniref:Uncharacterized protein n=1 Tax=Glossina palpalis gambiensis TaxID=67801 RepID=A0A1B0AUA4_9MUSC
MTKCPSHADTIFVFFVESSLLLLRHNGPLERFVGIESAEKDVSASLLTLIEKPLTLALMQLLFLLPLLFLNPSVSNFMILTFTLTVDT